MLCISAPVLESVILQWALGPFLENDIWKYDLGSRYACSYWNIVASRLSQLTEQGNICVYTGYILYVAICIYIKLNMNLYCYLQHGTSNSKSLWHGPF